MVLKYILFLGGNGFLGTNVIDFYRKYISVNSSEKIVFVVCSKTFHSNISSDIIFIQLDYSNTYDLDKLMCKYSFSEVFHFVSSSVPSTSNSDILSDINNNLIGTINLLNKMVQYKINKIIYLSSGGTVYGELNDFLYQEDEIVSQANSYGILKVTIENYIKLFNKTSNIDYLILRISNPFGYFHQSNVNGFVNIAVRKSIKNEAVEIWGDGTISKDYIFSQDLAKIFWKLYDKKITNEVINIGSGVCYSLLEIVDVIKLINPSTNIIFQDKKVFDTIHFDFNTDKLNSIVKVDYLNLFEAIKETYLWELKKLNKYI